ncbi:hypothetical protein D3C76_1094090 [compost metagenome]
MRTGHRQVITEDHPVKAQLAPQDVLQPAAREARRLVVDLRIEHMRRHHRRQLATEPRERHQIDGANLLQTTLVSRDGDVGISFGPAMTRKMLAACRHACGVHTANKGAGQHGGTLRITFERAAADYGAALVIKVQHWGETQVQTNRQHFRSHQPAALLGQVFGIVVVGNRAHRRQAYKALAQALHPATLLVDRQNQVRADGANRSGQFTHLTRTFDIAGKDDQAGHFGLAQQLAIFGGQPGTGDVHHQGALQAGTHN